MKNIGMEKIASVVGIVVGIVGTIALWQEKPRLGAGASLILVVAVMGLFYFSRPVSFYKIKKGLKVIHDELEKVKFYPDIIVAFNRSGSVLAGMLAVNYNVEQVLVISKVKLIVDKIHIKKKTYDIGSCVTLDPEQIRNCKILVAFFVVHSGETLEKGLEYLRLQKIGAEMKVATLYISSVARNKYSDIVHAYEVLDCEAILRKLPWVIDEYHIA